MPNASLKPKLICTALLILAFTGSAVGADFKVFDGTKGYQNGPALNNLKIKKLEIIYEADLVGPKPSPVNDNLLPTNDPSAEDENRIRGLAKTWKNKKIDLVCLDIERWPTNGNEQSVLGSIKKFKKVLGWIHQEAPNLKVGIYYVLPLCDITSSLKSPDSQSYKDWQAKNAQLKSLAQIVDVIFPSLYTFSIDSEKWKVSAKAILEQAAKYGKPVYPFIWPRYQDSIPILAWTFIPKEFWEMELQTVKEQANGVVVWDSGKGQPWDDQASWWQSIISINNLSNI